MCVESHILIHLYSPSSCSHSLTLVQLIIYHQAGHICCNKRDIAAQVPDLEAVVHTNDSPLVPEAAAAKEQPAPPIFGYTTAEGFADVPFPDFSYWGHEHGRLVGVWTLSLKPLHPGMCRAGTSSGLRCKRAHEACADVSLHTALLHSSIASAATPGHHP